MVQNVNYEKNIENYWHGMKYGSQKMLIMKRKKYYKKNNNKININASRMLIRCYQQFRCGIRISMPECLQQYKGRQGTSGKLRIFKLANLKSRVTIHGTIQIQRLLFKFVALFKISSTIQIQNMNSARALTREWLRHPTSNYSGHSLMDESDLRVIDMSA